MRTLRFTGLEGLRALREPWLSLHASADLYARYEWHLACATHLPGVASSQAYLQVLDGERTVAIVPMVVSNLSVSCLRGLRALGPVLHEHLELADFPLATDARIGDVANALHGALAEWPERWDVLYWPRALGSSNVMRLARALDARATAIVPRQPCDIIDTRRSFAEFLASCSKNLRASLRKSQKRLEQSGGSRIVCNAVPGGSKDAADALDAAFEAFLAIEASGWKGRTDAGSAIALDPSARAFYAGLLALRSADFSPEVTLLARGSAPIAAQFSVCVNGCKHVLKIGYDESESRFSPGQVLMAGVLEAASGGVLTRLDLVTDELWHQAWRPVAEPAYRVVAFRRRWRATLYRACTAVRSAAKSALLALRRRRPADA